MAQTEGTIYLIHFEKNYFHAGHYLGFAEGDNLDSRINQHKKGTGARLLQVIGDSGIDFECVRTWKGTRQSERKLKNRKDARSLCPVCKPERRKRQKLSRLKKQQARSNA